jgi:hypothetical protein
MLINVDSLAIVASRTKMVVPKDIYNYDVGQYLHWHCFVAVTLGCDDQDIALSNAYKINKLATSVLQSAGLADYKKLQIVTFPIG